MSEVRQSGRQKEPPIYRDIAIRKLLRRNAKLSEMQRYIPYHSTLLRDGDIALRNNYHIFAKGYLRFLNMEQEQVRAYMKRIPIDEVLGFSVQLINRPDDVEGLIDLPKSHGSDQDSDHTLVDYCSNDGDSQDDEATLYDEDGFFVGMVGGEEPNSPSTPGNPSLDLELENEIELQEALTSPLVSTPAESEPAEEFEFPMEYAPSVESDPPEYPNSWDLDMSDNMFLTNEPYLSSSRLSSSSSSSLASYSSESENFSSDLRELLAEIGMEPATKRTDKLVGLYEDEIKRLDADWAYVVAVYRRAELKRGAPHQETWAETVYLDGRDRENDLCNWQTEGLFLCRLTELVYQVSFQEARRTYLYWMSENRSAASQPTARPPQRPQSRLRNEVRR
ncbi:hypothetical protein F5Y07DRAFT_406895 [Xylaria sp. FL0933]|nr:hypothetical protein F5Y07DRAFT_406895 [Xylaria sp. FL0933]